MFIRTVDTINFTVANFIVIDALSPALKSLLGKVFLHKIKFGTHKV